MPITELNDEMRTQMELERVAKAGALWADPLTDETLSSQSLYSIIDATSHARPMLYNCMS